MDNLVIDIIGRDTPWQSGLNVRDPSGTDSSSHSTSDASKNAEPTTSTASERNAEATTSTATERNGAAHFQKSTSINKGNKNLTTDLEAELMETQIKFLNSKIDLIREQTAVEKFRKIKLQWEIYEFQQKYPAAVLDCFQFVHLN